MIFIFAVFKYKLSYLTCSITNFKFTFFSLQSFQSCHMQETQRTLMNIPRLIYILFHQHQKLK